MTRARLLLATVPLLLLGCVSTPRRVPSAPKPVPKAAPAPPPDLKVERYVSRDPVIAPQSISVAPKVAAFTWKETVGAGDVPAGPVTGVLRGRPFVCRHVSVTAREEDGKPTFRLRFSDQPRGPRCGLSLDDDNVTLEWSQPAGQGELAKALATLRPAGADAWYVFKQADGVPVTGNPEYACYLRIESVRGSTEPGGAPSLTGQVALCFADEARSWLAGHFVADGCR